jgi:formiminotetrahydrofolate cyclodeaminase
MTVSDFVAQVASAAPVPGGGSASAVAASLGAALVAMVAALSADRPKYADHAATHARAGAEGRRLADHLLALADEDSAAYAGFAAAMKLPRENDDERAARSAALRTAARAAADVPLACVEACRDVLVAAEALAGRSNVNAASDLTVAAQLVEAGARGAAANVRINLPAIGDDLAGAAIAARLDVLLAEVSALADRTREVVGSGVARAPVQEAVAR